MSNRALSAYERWTWQSCREKILSLKNRLGYDDRLWILGFELLDDGWLLDRFHQFEVFDPARAASATAIATQYSAVPEMYCVLSNYADAVETPLAGEMQSLASLDPIRSAGLLSRL